MSNQDQQSQELDCKEFTVDWKRSLLINTDIDDNLVKLLTPQILALRQESNDPITIGIDSFGGSISSINVLLGLLTGPNQDGKSGKIITVATHRAYSAAANLLALGTYSVALKHAEILYHDVRYGGMEDVTPGKAKDAAKSLQDANYAFALRLAHRAITRLIWIYIDQTTEFNQIQTKYPIKHKRYSDIVSAYAPPSKEIKGIDLVSFATTLWAKLSGQNDSLIDKVMERLESWINLTNIAQSAPTYRAKGSRIAGLLDGARHMHNKNFSGQAKHFQLAEENLKLLLSLIIADIAHTEGERVSFSSVVERAVSEYEILDSMNDSRHIQSALEIMMDYKHIFLGLEVSAQFKEKDVPEQKELIIKAIPHARLLWHFCVLLCRELFKGEHVLNPNDAQLLGLIDEVYGGGPIQSRRDWRISQKEESDKATEPAPGGNQ